MRLALCNEVLRDREFAAQCTYAAALGYDALEIAPFTLGDDPLALPASRRTEVRRAASDAGIAVSGLHWLLVKPEGLSVTSPDRAVRARTVEAMRSLIVLCAWIACAAPNATGRRSGNRARLDRGSARDGRAGSARGRRRLSARTAAP
jgi:sugar phosphate isomerase/epimerase